jgi:hypothetical protein
MELEEGNLVLLPDKDVFAYNHRDDCFPADELVIESGLVPSKPNFINQIDHSCCNDYYAL